MKQAAALLGELLAESGVVPGLARTAFATLIDNALEHGSERVSPVAAVYLSELFLTVSSRDAGQAVADSADPLGGG